MNADSPDSSSRPPSTAGVLRMDDRVPEPDVIGSHRHRDHGNHGAHGKQLGQQGQQGQQQQGLTDFQSPIFATFAQRRRGNSSSSSDSDVNDINENKKGHYVGQKGDDQEVQSNPSSPFESRANHEGSAHTKSDPTSTPNPDDANPTPDPEAENLDDKTAFPLLLHEIVSDPDTDDSIHWLPCGTRFIITDKQKFATQVLPKYYGHAKFTSFTRRLKRWSFSRVPSGPFMGAYYNVDFVRDDKERAKKVKYSHPVPLSVESMRANQARLQAVVGGGGLGGIATGLGAGGVGLGALGGSAGLTGAGADIGALAALAQRSGGLGNVAGLAGLLGGGGANMANTAGLANVASSLPPEIRASLLQGAAAANSNVQQENEVLKALLMRTLNEKAASNFGANVPNANNQLAMQLAMAQEMQRRQQMQGMQGMSQSQLPGPSLGSFEEQLIKSNPRVAAQILLGKHQQQQSSASASVPAGSSPSASGTNFPILDAQTKLLMQLAQNQNTSGNANMLSLLSGGSANNASEAQLVQLLQAQRSQQQQQQQQNDPRLQAALLLAQLERSQNHNQAQNHQQQDEEQQNQQRQNQQMQEHQRQDQERKQEQLRNLLSGISGMPGAQPQGVTSLPNFSNSASLNQLAAMGNNASFSNLLAGATSARSLSSSSSSGQNQALQSLLQLRPMQSPNTSQNVPSSANSTNALLVELLRRRAMSGEHQQQQGQGEDGDDTIPDEAPSGSQS